MVQKFPERNSCISTTRLFTFPEIVDNAVLFINGKMSGNETVIFVRVGSSSSI